MHICRSLYTCAHVLFTFLFFLPLTRVRTSAQEEIRELRQQVDEAQAQLSKEKETNKSAAPGRKIAPTSLADLADVGGGQWGGRGSSIGTSLIMVRTRSL